MSSSQRAEPLVIRVPGSKSVTQRALVAAALAPGHSELHGALWCEDSEHLTGALRSLGVGVTWQGRDRVLVEGRQRLRAPRQTLHLGNAGTAMRFLAAASLAADGPVTLDGVEAMRRRPMPGLLEALRRLGAQVECHDRPGCPPVTIRPPARPARRVELDPSGSSQQLSGLLLAAPAAGGLEIRPSGRLVSAPYVDLTLEVMAAFGIAVRRTGRGTYLVPPGPYRPQVFHVEGDHSSASYPLAAGWLTGKAVRVENLRPDSKQPDRVFPQLLARLAGSGDLELDLSASPDIAPTVATCALFRKRRTRLVGLSHLRIKESDRLEVLARGLQAVGGRVTVHADGWSIQPAGLHGHVLLDPAGDHRMAMCFGLLGLRLPAVQVLDRACVRKSYPEFWEMLDLFRGERVS